MTATYAPPLYIADRTHGRNVVVALTDSERRGAVDVGAWLYEKSHRDGRRDRHGFEDAGRGLRIQTDGAIAERVVAKALCIYWPGHVDQGAEADLPHGIEVRFMAGEHYGLRLRERDHDARAFVAVVPEGHAFRIPGWTFGAMGKRQEWAMAPNGRPTMYAVPQPALWPLVRLAELVRAGVLSS